MIDYIDRDNIEKIIVLSLSLNLVLTKKEIHGNKNIFLVDKDCKTYWQIYTDFDNDESGSFTNIFLENNIAKAYRWDGGIYNINTETGKAVPDLLVK